MDKTSSQNGGNQLFNGDVSDNNNSVAYQASINSSHSSQHQQQQMMNEKDTTKASADCTDASTGASGKYFINSICVFSSILYFTDIRS